MVCIGTVAQISAQVKSLRLHPLQVRLKAVGHSPLIQQTQLHGLNPNTVCDLAGLPCMM